MQTKERNYLKTILKDYKNIAMLKKKLAETITIQMSLASEIIDRKKCNVEYYFVIVARCSI